MEKYTLLSHKKYLIPHNNSNSSPPPLSGFLCFQFLSTDEVQPWAVDEEEEEDKDLKSKGTETSLISAAAAEEEDKTLLKSQNKIMVASAEKEKC